MVLEQNLVQKETKVKLRLTDAGWMVVPADHAGNRWGSI